MALKNELFLLPLDGKMAKLVYFRALRSYDNRLHKAKSSRFGTFQSRYTDKARAVEKGPYQGVASQNKPSKRNSVVIQPESESRLFWAKLSVNQSEPVQVRVCKLSRSFQARIVRFEPESFVLSQSKVFESQSAVSSEGEPFRDGAVHFKAGKAKSSIKKLQKTKGWP